MGLSRKSQTVIGRWQDDFYKNWDKGGNIAWLIIIFQGHGADALRRYATTLWGGGLVAVVVQTRGLGFCDCGEHNDSWRKALIIQYEMYLSIYFYLIGAEPQPSIDFTEIFPYSPGFDLRGW